MAATRNRYRAATVAARLAPRRLVPAIARLGGRAVARLATQRHAMLARHLGRVDRSATPEAIDRAATAGFASYARYWVESLRLPYLDPSVVDAGFRVDGIEYLHDALDAGRGAILALPHLGGWEWAGRWLAQRHIPVTVVVERLEPPEVFEWFVGLRERLGMKVLPLGPDVAREIMSALARNEVVCLLCDRDLGRRGVEVSFFGERTTLPAGPAMLSRRSGAPILPAAVYFTDRPDGHVALVLPPISAPASRPDGRSDRKNVIAEMTQRLAGALEELIERAPEQWHLLQPNWPSDPGYSDGAGAKRPTATPQRSVVGTRR